jgi:hypothetical protein
LINQKTVDLSFWFAEFCLNSFFKILYQKSIGFFYIHDFCKIGDERFLKQNRFLKPCTRYRTYEPTPGSTSGLVVARVGVMSTGCGIKKNCDEVS